jgi:hypothetical protein
MHHPLPGRRRPPPIVMAAIGSALQGPTVIGSHAGGTDFAICAPGARTEHAPECATRTCTAGSTERRERDSVGLRAWRRSAFVPGSAITAG